MKAEIQYIFCVCVCVCWGGYEPTCIAAWTVCPLCRFLLLCTEKLWVASLEWKSNLLNTRISSLHNAVEEMQLSRHLHFFVAAEGHHTHQPLHPAQALFFLDDSKPDTPMLTNLQAVHRRGSYKECNRSTAKLCSWKEQAIQKKPAC